MTTDTAAGLRQFWHDRPLRQKLGGVTGVALAVFHLYTSLFGCLDSLMQRTIHLGLVLLLVYLLFPAGKTNRGNRLDLVMGVLVGAVLLYLLVRYDWVTAERFPLITPLSPLEVALGVLTIVLVLEAARRIISRGLFYIALAFLLYPYVAPYLPGVLHATPIDWTAVIDFNYLSLGGIFGIPLGVSATEIALFIIFGAVLMRSGGSFLISNIATTIAGRAVGGPAKVAVVASSLMGTISGSGTANVATVGSITIPMMKKAGYHPNFAAAVEAVASTGGQIMPPVMGAAAFVMAAFSGIPYSEIIVRAFFPAFLYYLSLYFTVDMEARRLRLGHLRPDITFLQTLRDYGHMILPIVILVYLLVAGYTPRLAGGLGTVAALIVCQLRPTTRLSLPAILSALESGAKGMLIVAVSCATAGIIVGAVDLTGLGQRLGAAFMSLSGGNLALGLVLGMLIAILLGLGLPTTPAYIVQAATVIPALIKLGLPTISAHLFAFYFSCLAIITPPDASAAYTAAAIANADGWKTGWLASRLGLIAYIVPFMFAFDQSLLLVGPVAKVLVNALTACVGVYCLVAACEGYILRKMKWPQRVLAGLAAVLLLIPVWRLSLAGLMLLLGLLLLQWRGRENEVRVAVTQENR